MDVLSSKQYNSYDYINRYSSIPYYYHTLDNKYIYGVSKNLIKETSYVIHKVKSSDTLDYLALKYYNNPLFYWVIADFNSIIDPYINLVDYFEEIKIPNISNIQFNDLRSI